MAIFELVDWLALGWFLFSWGGYTLFAKYRKKRHNNIANSLTSLRASWVERMLSRGNRIADTTTLGILQRTVTFFASTSILILAGLMAVLGASDEVTQLVRELPFVVEHSQIAWEVKVLLMILIFIYAFFKFSWSVRQYNFALVLFGSAPLAGDRFCKDFITGSNKLLTSANDSFNYGLRAFNFSMATLAWFVHPVLFIAATTWVVAVLYRREFKSRTLLAMGLVINSLNQ